MKIKKFSKTFLLFCLIVVLYGCEYVAGSVVVISAATWSYMGGKVEREYSAPLPVVRKTVLVILEDYQVETEVNEYDSSTEMIRGEMYDGKKITIRLKQESSNITAVAIRISPMGNKDISESIHDRIALELSGNSVAHSSKNTACQHAALAWGRTKLND